VCLCVCA
jgi:large subunit ribosomal protein L35e